MCPDSGYRPFAYIEAGIEKSCALVSPEVVASRVHFIKAFSSDGLLEADTVRDFLCAIESVDGAFLRFLQGRVQVRLMLPDGLSMPVLTLTAAGWASDPVPGISVQPWEMLEALAHSGISIWPAIEYLAFFRTYIDASRCKYAPYKRCHAVYYADRRAVIRDAENFVVAFESFESGILS